MQIRWETASEIDTEGFHVWRNETPDGEFTRITTGIIGAEGGETWGASYAVEDSEVDFGTSYFYKLEVVDVYGNSTYHGPVEAAAAGGLCFFKSILD